MCILCDKTTLERLTRPLETFGPGELAEAIRDAREAAPPGVLDYAEAVLRDEAPARPGPALYAEVVIARALENGVLDESRAFEWERRLRGKAGALDPRVQAFVSACVEVLDDYLVVVDERSQVLARFLEAPLEAVRFEGLGQDGEIWFGYRGRSHTVLTSDEAMEIVEREVGANLHEVAPEILLRYTTLPDAGLEVITGVLGKPPEVANDILYGMIDVPLLADDRVRSMGYGPFFGEPTEPAEDLRFGEWVIVRASPPH